MTELWFRSLGGLTLCGVLAVSCGGDDTGSGDAGGGQGGSAAAGNAAGGNAGTGIGGDATEGGGMSGDAGLGNAPACGFVPVWYPPPPFEVMLADASSGGAAGRAGAGGEAGAPTGSTSGCSLAPDGPTTTTTCSGSARAVQTTGSAMFEFDDGSQLSWRAAYAAGMPEPAFARGTHLWLDYTATHEVLCSVCGTYDGWTLSIRAAENGEIEWLGRGGHVEELDAGELSSLLGVTEHRVLACRTRQRDCEVFDADVFDHVLETDPPQRIPYASSTRADTPNGAYDLYFATFSVPGAPACADMVPPDGGRNFAASRVEP